MKVKPMTTWPAVQVMVATLLLPIAVSAQKDVVITVKYEETSTRDNLYHFGFSGTLFTTFKECLFLGHETCEATTKDLATLPRLQVKNINSIGVSHNGNDQYYNCRNDKSSSFLQCKWQENPQLEGAYTQTYIARDTLLSQCIWFVWTLDAEGINFTRPSDELGVEFCGNSCSCLGKSTNPQSETTTPSSSSSKGSTTTPTAVSSISHSSSLLITIKKTSSTLTTTESSGNASTKTSDDDTPIGIILGAVVGVIALTVIIIIIVVVWRKRKARPNSSSNAGRGGASITSSSDAGVGGKRNDGKSHSYYNSEFSNHSELDAPKNDVVKINGYQNSLHQPNITKNGMAPVTDPHKPQFAIKDNDSDFGYSTAQLVVPEDNNRNVNSKKFRDDYDYVYAEDDVGVSDPNSQTTRDKTPVVSPPKVRDDYAVVDKTRKNKNPGNNDGDTGLMSDYDDIPEDDYGYSHAEGDASAHVTSDEAVGNAHVMVPKSSLLGASDLNQDFGYEYSRTSDGYATVGKVNQSYPNNDDPNATCVYSRLHEQVRDIQNPYNVGPNTNDVYSKLHEEVRDIKNPYNVLPESQGPSDSNTALPDTAHNAQDNMEQKPSKSLPYGPQDYAVVVKTKSASKPTQSTFELENDDN